MGFIQREQSKHDSVSTGSAILPSIGWGWCTILKPSLCIKISSQKKVIRLSDFIYSTSEICKIFSMFISFSPANLKKASSKFVLTLI